jgi:hypothetical protein
MLSIARLAILAVLASLVLHAEPALVLYLDNNVHGRATQQGMKAEFEDLMGPSGVRVEWRNLTGKRQAEAGQVIVVHFRGDCSASASKSTVADGATLASVQEVDGRILPFVEVQCSLLAALVYPNIRDQAPFQQRLLFGRALGRVLAHEVNHITTQTAHHTNEGITRARLNGTDLTQNPEPHRLQRVSIQTTGLGIDGAGSSGDGR